MSNREWAHEQLDAGPIHYPLLLAFIFTARRFLYLIAGLALIGTILEIGWFYIPVALALWGVLYRGIWHPAQMARMQQQVAEHEQFVDTRELPSVDDDLSAMLAVARKANRGLNLPVRDLDGSKRILYHSSQDTEKDNK